MNRVKAGQYRHSVPIAILIHPPFCAVVAQMFSEKPTTAWGSEKRGRCYLLDNGAIKAIENAMQDGCTVEVKVENGNVVVVQKREKRTVTYRGLAVKG